MKPGDLVKIRVKTAVPFEYETHLGVFLKLEKPYPTDYSLVWYRFLTSDGTISILENLSGSVHKYEVL